MATFENSEAKRFPSREEKKSLEEMYLALRKVSAVLCCYPPHLVRSYETGSTSGLPSQPGQYSSDLTFAYRPPPAYSE